MFRCLIDQLLRSTSSVKISAIGQNRLCRPAAALSTAGETEPCPLPALLLGKIDTIVPKVTEVCVNGVYALLWLGDELDDIWYGVRVVALDSVLVAATALQEGREYTLVTLTAEWMEALGPGFDVLARNVRHLFPAQQSWGWPAT